MTDFPTAEELARALDGERQGRRFMARCPAHEDRTPSLSIEAKDGKTLFRCHAGCDQGDVLAALREKGLWPEEREESGLTLVEYAQHKRLKSSFLRDVGLSDYTHKYYGDVLRIPYFGSDGREVAVRYRLALHKSAGGRFRWTKGSKVLPYGLNRLDAARDAGRVTLVEGESDAQTLWQAGEPALGVPGANTWKNRWAEYLDGVGRVYVVIEPDRGGEALRAKLGKSPLSDRLHLLDLGDYSDISAFYLASPDDFPERLKKAMEEATPWAELAEKQANRKAAEAYKLAEPLLDAPDLLGRIGRAIRGRGYVGELRPPLLVYVAMTSRLLERPQNVAVVAQSSAGKSFTVDVACELMPPEAYHLVRAGSSRALVYTEEPFEHRVVIFGEADSIPEDGPAASAVRSIAADNMMSYDVVERDEETGKWGVRHIEKPGPTGMITTSTRSLGEQMATRMLEVTVPDDERQTRSILYAHAAGVAGGDGRAVDVAPFVALQRWLALAGRRKVIVPFAGVLADNMPDIAQKAVRMRRDFRQLLTCIQSIALLYQRQRPTAGGAVVATIGDYAMARDLLEDVFGAIASEGVTPAIRETVEAIEPGEEVSQAELARRLDVSRSTMAWRVRKAKAAGWLVDNKEKRGATSRLAHGAPLPEDVDILPDPAVVREAFEHSNIDSNIVSLEVEGEMFEDSSPFGGDEERTRQRSKDAESSLIYTTQKSFEHSNIPPDSLEVERCSSDRSSVRMGANGETFAPAEVDQLAGPADEDGRRPVEDGHGLYFDEDGRLWDDGQKPLQGTIRWLRGRLETVRTEE